MTIILLIILGFYLALRGYPTFKRKQIERDKSRAYKQYKNQFNKPKTN